MKYFDLHTWKIRSLNAQRLVMQPTVWSLRRRLGVILVCLFLACALSLELYKNQKQRSVKMASKEQHLNYEVDALTNEMVTGFIEQGLITNEEIDEINRKSQERVVASRIRINAFNDKVLPALFCVIVFFGLLSSVSLIWERVEFSTNIRGEMVVLRRNFIFWTSKHLIPEDTIKNIYIVAREHLTGNRKLGYKKIGWIWEVNAQGDDDEGVAVFIDLSLNRPKENGNPPENVQQVADALSIFTGCYLQPSYIVTNVDSLEHSLFNTYVNHSGTRTTREQIYPETDNIKHKSIDELPPEIRIKFEEARARGETGPIHIEHEQSVQLTPGHPIIYRAPDNSEHIYQSIEEMPPELQDIFKDLKQ